jgi:hypothetical protein
MLLLLSFNEQNTIKPISLNNEDRYNQIATEVESLELDKLLGYAFYQAVAANPENYTDLLNGCSFVVHRRKQYLRHIFGIRKKEARQ